MVGIYKIENRVNGKIYIGQSLDIFQRWNQHYLIAETAEIDDVFHYDLKKNPKDFIFNIVEICEPEDLNQREEYYINRFNTIESGYNTRSAPKTVHKKKENDPPTHQEIIKKLEEIIGKPLFKEDKEELAIFFQFKDSRGNLKKWNTVKKNLINNGFDIMETKRTVNGKIRNCSIVKPRWNFESEVK